VADLVAVAVDSAEWVAVAEARVALEVERETEKVGAKVVAVTVTAVGWIDPVAQRAAQVRLSQPVAR